MTRVAALAAALFWLPVVSGCGGPNASLQGTVNVDGAPLTNGDVNLVPIPGSPGNTAGALIENGKFNIPAARGPLPGKYKVHITATRPAGKKYVSDDPLIEGKVVQGGEQYLPPRYNSKTELTVSIQPGRNEASFDLTTKN